MPLQPKVRELLIEAAKHYRMAFALGDEAVLAWHNHLGANPPLKAHRQPGATREERKEKAATEAELWLKKRTKAIVADSTRRNGHLLLNSFFGNLGLTNEDLEGGEIEERVCPACAKRFPVKDLYYVRFKDSPEMVILCEGCYDLERTGGREVAYLGTLDQVRPQPPAEDDDDKAPDPHPSPRGRGGRRRGRGRRRNAGERGRA